MGRTVRRLQEDIWVFRITLGQLYDVHADAMRHISGCTGQDTTQYATALAWLKRIDEDIDLIRSDLVRVEENIDTWRQTDDQEP